MDPTVVTPQNDEQVSQVRIQLKTRDPEVELSEETGPILVSTGLRRYALSTLVNNLLNSEKPIPFEFLINGNFLRTSLDEFLTANGISAETILTVEYVRAIIPPVHLASFLHDDWVSSVDVLSSKSPAGTWGAGGDPEGVRQERILSAGYDGLLRVWNMSSEIVATSPSAAEGGHGSSIKSAKFLSPSKLVSSGLDRTVRVWNFSELGDENPPASISPALELYGHRGSVDSLAVHGPSARLLSASADHTVGVWSSNKSSGPPADASLIPNATRQSSNKRRKLSSQTPQLPKRGPLSLLKAHTAPVSDTAFHPTDPTVAYSVSWDHTLRTWDLTTSALVDTRTTSHPLLSLAALSTLSLLAAGTSARHIALIDPRASAKTTVPMTLRGHSNAVVTLAAHPGSPYGLVSGSHDGTCRVWDVRSVRAAKSSEGQGQVVESMFMIRRESIAEADGQMSKPGGEGVKVFGVAWDDVVGIVSCGEDKRVQINRGRDLGNTAIPGAGSKA